MRLLDLPIIDTLELSAIAFPTNPYHRLVKGYKLLADSRNDPLRDARLTLDLLGDEVDALAAMHRTDAVWVRLPHFLLRGDAPLDQLLREVRGMAAPAPSQAATEATLNLLLFALPRQSLGWIASLGPV